MDFSKSFLDNLLDTPKKKKKDEVTEFNEYLTNMGLD